jgi:hypothetical protein
MKMVLHYLHFDWKRWRVLLLALWGVLAACVLLAWMVRWQTQPGPWLSRLETSIQICTALATLCAVGLGVMAGGADSPVAATTWLMTRPRRTRALVTARLLLIVMGVVLPAAASHGLTLAVMKFSADTVHEAFAESMVLTCVFAAGVMLWALVRPCLPGVAVGAAAGGLAALPMLFPALRLPEEWIEADPSPILVCLMLSLPAVTGLCGLCRRQSRRQWALSGLVAGVLITAALVFLPVAENLKRRLVAGKIERLVFPHKFADWELSLTKPGPGNPTQLLTTEITWDLTLEIPRLPDGIALASGTVEAIAWRDGPNDRWSNWVPARGDFYIVTREHDWLLSVSCDPRKIQPLNNGELRVKTRLNFERRDTPRMPLRPGAFISGNGWSCEVLEFSEDSRGGFSWTALTRSGGGHEPAMPLVVPDWTRAESELYDSSRDSTLTRTRFMGISSTFSSHTRNLKDRKAPSRPVPEFVSILNTATAESFRKTVYLTGVTLSLSVKQPPPDRPLPRWVPPSPTDAWLGNVNPSAPRPWLEAAPHLPGEAATDAEVAVYLDRLVNDVATGRYFMQRLSPSERTQLASLVPRWLPVFLEAVMCYGDRGGMFRDVLIGGIPEGRKEELLRHIPEAPWLAEVAMARGWQAEAKPFVLQAVERNDRIPTEIEALCRSYRDPAFHPAMRKWFTADVPTVRYWESMPDLAPDLPVQLANVMEYLLSLQRHVREMKDLVAALLYVGDSRALDLLLRSWRGDPSQSGWPYPLLRRWVRDRDESKLPPAETDLTTWIGESTAADYGFDTVRRHFVRKPANSNR